MFDSSTLEIAVDNAHEALYMLATNRTRPRYRFNANVRTAIHVLTTAAIKLGQEREQEANDASTE